MYSCQPRSIRNVFCVISSPHPVNYITTKFCRPSKPDFYNKPTEYWTTECGYLNLTFGTRRSCPTSRPRRRIPANLAPPVAAPALAGGGRHRRCPNARKTETQFRHSRSISAAMRSGGRPGGATPDHPGFIPATKPILSVIRNLLSVRKKKHENRRSISASR
jgi:hypothetical protein